MDTLPEELLEKIFSYLSPYREYYVAACVCKAWNRILNGMIQYLPYKFEQDLKSGNIEWFSVVEGLQTTSVSPRTGHCICYNDYSRGLFVFGGKSVFGAGAGFNDLLQLDLQSLLWIRPIAKGSIPPPKYGCSLSSYKQYLILFGGSFLPPVNTLHRGVIEYSSDLHIFNIETHEWIYKPFLVAECPNAIYEPKTCIVTDQDDCELDILLMYSGIINSFEKRSNTELWCFILSTWTWEKQIVIKEKEANPFELSKVSINQIKSSTYSSAVLVLGLSQETLLPLLWFMCKTGPAQWTVQKLELITDSPVLFTNINFDMPCLLLGKTLVVFRSTCLEQVIPSANEIKSPKCIFSKTVAKPTSKGVISSSLHSRHSLSTLSLQMPVRSKIYMFLLDLNLVETDRQVKCVPQIDHVTGKLDPSFIGSGITSSILAVIGKGEIILHSSVKSGKRSYMSLSIVRSQR